MLRTLEKNRNIPPPKNTVYIDDDVMLSFRLQPIHNFNKNIFSGYEVLSRVHSHNKSAESFFRELSAPRLLTLIKDQVTRANLSSICGRYYININLECLNSDLVKWFAANCKKKLALEIDYHDICQVDFDSLQLERLNKNILLLKRLGHEVWLDDFDGIFSQKARCILDIIKWDGIKLDKSVLWMLASQNQSALRNIVNLCSNITKKVLIEGVESLYQYNISKMSGACFGQGFYWSDIYM